MDTTPYTVADYERAARIAKVLIQAALRNVNVQDRLRDLNPAFGPRYTLDDVRTNPPVRHEFEHAYIVCGVGEGIAAGRNKPTFGQFIGILPIEPDDPVSSMYVLYVYKDSSPYNRRVIQRRWLKRRLGRRWKPMVTKVMRLTKTEWLAKCDPDQRYIIRAKLGMDPGHFWRVVKGKVFIDIPKPRDQPELFE